MIAMRDRDVTLLFATRCLRMFGYGFLSTVLVLYLSSVGYSGSDIGLLLALTLLGDAAISLWLTTHADRIGRRRVLVIGAALMLVAGGAFVSTPVLVVLAIAATIGVMSPSGNEVGPFLAVEQAALAQLVPDRGRTSVFARYQLVGSFATAFGALVAGATAQLAIGKGASDDDAYRLVIAGYALVGVVIAILFLGLDGRVEAPPRSVRDEAIRTRLGLHRSQRVVVLTMPRARAGAWDGLVFDRASSRSGSSSGSGSIPRPSAHCCSGPTCLRGSPRSPRVRWRHASASSTRWCSRTCPRTCC